MILALAAAPLVEGSVRSVAMSTTSVGKNLSEYHRPAERSQVCQVLSKTLAAWSLRAPRSTSLLW